MKNLKKLIAVVLVVALAALPLSAGYAMAKEREPAVSFLFSLSLPGFGEWYNRDFDGTVPIAEMCMGWICFFVTISSIVDGVKGCTDEEIRFDFWGKASCKS